MSEFAVAEAFDPLTAEEYEALKESIDNYGVIVPIVVDENGQIIDGRHRAQIAEELGIDLAAEGRIVTFDSEGDATDVAQLAYDLNVHRRQVSTAARNEAIVRLRKEGYPIRAIAAQVGVSPTTVAKATKEVAAEDIKGRLSGQPVAAESPLDRWASVLRKRAAGMSQAKIAEQAGVTQATISNDVKALKVLDGVGDMDTKLAVVKLACDMADARGGNRVPTAVELRAAIKAHGGEPEPEPAVGADPAEPSAPPVPPPSPKVRAIEVIIWLPPDIYASALKRALAADQTVDEAFASVLSSWAVAN